MADTGQIPPSVPGNNGDRELEVVDGCWLFIVGVRGTVAGALRSKYYCTLSYQVTTTEPL